MKVKVGDKIYDGEKEIPLHYFKGWISNIG